jgi:hypothetical protein
MVRIPGRVTLVRLPVSISEYTRADPAIGSGKRPVIRPSGTCCFRGFGDVRWNWEGPGFAGVGDGVFTFAVDPSPIALAAVSARPTELLCKDKTAPEWIQRPLRPPAGNRRVRRGHCGPGRRHKTSWESTPALGNKCNAHRPMECRAPGIAGKPSKTRRPPRTRADCGISRTATGPAASSSMAGESPGARR